MKWTHGKKRMFMAAAISAITILCGVLSLAGWLGWTSILLEPGTTDDEPSEGVLTSGYTFAEEPVSDGTEDSLRDGLDEFAELADRQGVLLEDGWEEKMGFVAHLYCVNPWELKEDNLRLEPIHPLASGVPTGTSQWYVVQVDIDSFRQLKDRGLPIKVDPELSRAYLLPAAPATDTSLSLAGDGTEQTSYRSIDVLLSDLQQMATNYPSISELVDFGDSYNKTVGSGGYDLLALKVTNKSIPGPKPVFLMISMMHGNEIASGETAMMYLDWLLTNYGQDADATWIVDHHEIWVAPAVNPDGRWGVYPTRKNANGVDLNRNFTFKWGVVGSSSDPSSTKYRGESPASEPETQAIEALQASLFPDQRGTNDVDVAPADATGIFLSLHTHGQLVMYPWGHKNEVCPNAQNAIIGGRLAVENSYTPTFAAGLYPTSGTAEEHCYGLYGNASFIFELGTTHDHDFSYVRDNMWPRNRGAFQYMAKIARTPYMTGQGPDAHSILVSTTGTILQVSSTIDDDHNGGDTITAGEAYIEDPPWVVGAEAHTLSVSDGSLDSSVEIMQGAVDIGALSPGKHMVLVRGQDATGNWGPLSAVWVYVETPPQITAQPVDASVTEGDTATFSVEATGTTPLGYQWRKDGSPIANATGATYSAVAPTIDDNGSMLSVLVSNIYGTAISTQALLTVTLPPVSTAHWKLNEASGSEAVDSSGNGHTGTLYGSPAWVTGKRGSGLSFDEVDDRVTVPGFDFGTDGKFSVMFWFNTSDLSGDSYEYIFSHGEVGTKNSLNIYFYEGDPYSSGALRSVLLDGNDSSSHGALDVSGAWDDGQWHHYAIVVDASGSKVYIDGTEMASSTLGGDAYSRSTALYFGGREDLDPARYYGGKMDDMRVYSGALSEYDINQVIDEMAAVTYTITATAGSGGLIDPVGEIAVVESNDQAFVISPDIGYAISNVLVDSVSVGAVSGYTFSNVTENHTIDASFVWVPDVEAPSVPQDLSATAATYSQIDLSWTASTDNVGVAGYELSRNGSYLTSVAGTSYSDTGLNPETEYSYTVLAYDAATNKSAQSASASATTMAQPESLVAHWKLDDGSGTNMLDSSGNGHTGTLYGDPEWVSGTNLGAVYCDGAGDWLSFPEVLDMEAGTNWTVMLWFRLDTLPSDSNDIWLWKYVDTTETGDTILYVDDDDGIKAFNGQKIDSGIKVQTNVWYHVAGVKSGSSYSIYVNGQQEVSSASYNFSTTGSGYEIFKDDGRVWGHGAVDDVRVYAAALGHTEITNIMYSVEGEEPFVVRIGPPAASDGSFSLSFDSDPGQMYEVLYKDDLMSTNDWQVLTNGIEGTGSAIEWEDPNPGIRGFYRIREEM